MRTSYPTFSLDMKSYLYRSGVQRVLRVERFFGFLTRRKNERATHTTRARGTNAVSLVRIDLMATIGSSLSSKYFNENDFCWVWPVFTVEHRKNRLDRIRRKEARENCYKHHYAPNNAYST